MEWRSTRWFRWIRMMVMGVLVALAVNQFGVALSVVNGTSMQPTLENGDRLLVNKFSFLFEKPKVGDVITFEDPSQNGRYLVKRVIGIPGDRIEIKNGAVYRNGKRVNEPYAKCPVEDGNFGPMTVKPETVFVMGDNRQRFASRDSRYESVGLVPYHLIDGKVELILYRPSLEAFL
ncbi:signal peptidase I [Polycladomyces abyssicola]|uniref:Signal peptidase I n=1 Tax=Polycladomyces abyssicola TaxID=1125966 RepID=A0A8D5UG50_9BACL|nr:signal peptidase I [Polycladomyces abyssicola]BCU82946.1 signal peptidase I [Polycladomyces abyssicola]